MLPSRPRSVRCTYAFLRNLIREEEGRNQRSFLPSSFRFEQVFRTFNGNTGNPSQFIRRVDQRLGSDEVRNWGLACFPGFGVDGNEIRGRTAGKRKGNLFRLQFFIHPQLGAGYHLGIGFSCIILACYG